MPAHGMGLAIMQYRARMMHGTVIFERGALGGAMVRCTVPSMPAEAAGEPMNAGATGGRAERRPAP